MDISDLLLKAKRETLSSGDRRQLRSWLRESDENRIFYERLMNVEGDLDKQLLEELDSMTAWADIYSDYRKVSAKMHRSKRRLHLFGYAAVTVILISMATWGYFRYTFVSESPVARGVVLELSDGTQMDLTDEGELGKLESQGTIVIDRKDKSIQYKNTNAWEQLRFNTLRVPNGLRYKLKLSDGSTVYLNSGSSLRYPEKFLEGKLRKVFLIGEAFFDVAKDAKHPFIVATGEVDVRVLGTRFNVNAYPELAKVNTVLESGAVLLSENKTDGTSIYELKPGDRGSWDKQEGKMSIDGVDTFLFTAWMEGKLIFRAKPFSEIKQVLERFYDVEIVNNYRELENREFTGTFDLEAIKEVIDIFSEETDFKYSIRGKKVIIDPPD